MKTPRATRTPSQPGWAIPPGQPFDARALLTQLYWAAVQAVSPGPALRAALDRLPDIAPQRRVWLIAVGKAANPMAIAAVDVLAAHGMEPAGGVIVAPRALPPPHAALQFLAGDHPLPGARSAAAANAIGNIAATVRPEDEVWVLLSGGASSLIGAPEGTVRAAELRALYTVLLGSGLDIGAVNVIRKRFTRWGAGRLASALAPARVRNFIISDVIGDDLGAVGSGPCVPDPWRAADVHLRLLEAKLWDRIPPSVRRALLAVERDPSLETIKPGDVAFTNVERRVVASNRVALDAIATRARDFGYAPVVLSTALAGEAATVGQRLATTLLTYADASRAGPAGRSGLACLIWGGETTVTLELGCTGVGGRCQELALAAARVLAGGVRGRTRPGVSLLAAGTDGRDGPTDAAGAIVGTGTWKAIINAGRDPARDLAHHDAHPALDAAGALLRTDLTATNVMDVVIGLNEMPADVGLSHTLASAARTATP